jgi:thiol-disulfide isomerase/thioredoxin
VDPSSPYRQDKPLADLIPPDRRRAKAAALVIASMIVGACLFALASWGLPLLGTTTAPPPPPPVPIVTGTAHLGDAVLDGPDGRRSIAPGRLAVVHVWLQGCADCMPAFEALRDLEARGGFELDVPEINISYGRSDPAWATRYGVRENLLWDVGGTAVVRPLGISTFTTLVVDATGLILARDRPDQPGYAERVRSILRAHGATVAPSPTPTPAAATLTQVDVETVVARHTAAVRACWDRFAPEATSTKIDLRLVVDTSGTPTKIEASGDAPRVGDCVRREVATWRFPRPLEATALAIPFAFSRK